MPMLKLFILRLRGTVVRKIWWKVLLMIGYASVIVYLYEYYRLYEKQDVPRNLNIFQVLGIVTGLLLVFRTNTAYDRYWEGRKLWSEMVQNIRIVTRTVWVMVDDKKDPKTLVGKISLLNLLVGFSYATKHYLRNEFSTEEEDLKVFISHLPHLLTPSSNEPLEGQELKSTNPSQGTIKRPRKMSEERRNFGSIGSFMPEHERRLHYKTNIPLEISCFISAYIAHCKDENLIDPSMCRVLDTAVANMVRCLSGFERIRRTPIPFAYNIHLHTITWIVLLMLPFVWTQELHYYTVPAVALASFALLGILGIGKEIENPFGREYNDLNLDDFCKVIQKEVMAIISQPMPKLDDWMFSENNHPIITNYDLTAPELVKMKYEDIQNLLSGGKYYKFFQKSKASSTASGFTENSTSSQKLDKTSRGEKKV